MTTKKATIWIVILVLLGIALYVVVGKTEWFIGDNTETIYEIDCCLGPLAQPQDATGLY